MTFEQFASIARDWATRMTPAQVKLAASSIVQLPIDLPPKISAEAALELAAKGADEPIRTALLAAAKSAPAIPWAHPSALPASKRCESKPRQQAVQVGKPEGNGGTPNTAQPVAKRARELVCEQLKNGPRPEATVMAAAHLADIPKRTLIAAASALGVRTQRGQWWLPG